MSTFGSLFIAVIVAVVLMGGPFTLFILIKWLNSAFGSLKANFVKLSPKEAGDPQMGLIISWDNESFEVEVFRIKIEFAALVRGGRSTSLSFTFEGKGYKKKSFMLPLKLDASDFEMLTDAGLTKNSVSRSFVNIEVENTNGEVVRFKIPKAKIRETMAGVQYIPNTNEVEPLAARAPDSWSLQTRVFPWRAVKAEAEAPAAKAHGAAKPKAAAGPTLVDFLVTKVWIEPGCIVCDACENEAPLVFHVLADTCIVRENAPLDDGGSIAAAAEGCPVDVIKYETKPKAAAAS